MAFKFPQMQLCDQRAISRISATFSVRGSLTLPIPKSWLLPHPLSFSLLSISLLCALSRCDRSLRPSCLSFPGTGRSHSSPAFPPSPSRLTRATYSSSPLPLPPLPLPPPPRVPPLFPPHSRRPDTFATNRRRLEG